MKAFEVLASPLIVQFRLILTSTKCVRLYVTIYTQDRSPKKHLKKTTLRFQFRLRQLDLTTATRFSRSCRSSMSKLQRTQNSFARVVTNTRRARLRNTDPCWSIHRLPITARIDYTIAVLTFKSLVSEQRSHLREQFDVHQPTGSLISSSRANPAAAWTVPVHLSAVVPSAMQHLNCLALSTSWTYQQIAIYCII